jgi:hypothetical protein
MLRWLVDNELESTWKEVVVAWLEYYFGICLQVLRKCTKIAGVRAKIRNENLTTTCLVLWLRVVIYQSFLSSHPKVVLLANVNLPKSTESRSVSFCRVAHRTTVTSLWSSMVSYPVINEILSWYWTLKVCRNVAQLSTPALLVLYLGTDTQLLWLMFMVFVSSFKPCFGVVPQINFDTR